MQLNLTGFLNGKNAREFMGELWALLVSAQNSPDGIPAELIENKKEEIKQRQVTISSFKNVMLTLSRSFTATGI